MRFDPRAFVTAMRSLLLVFALVGCSSSPKPITTPTTSATTDPRVRTIAHEELDAAVAKFQPSAAVAIVLDAKTGAVLAAEGYPDASVATNRTFVTGSTLKTILVAAALEEGTITPETKVDCATRMYGTEELHDASPHGTLTISEALATSSNVGASRVFDTLGLERTYAWFRKFHLDDAPSHLPVVDDGKSARAAMFATGELAETTPMQMAAAYVPIVNGGIYVAPGVAPKRVLREDTVAKMIPMLEGVVTSELGTGKLARVEGHRAAGKTGTGEHHGNYWGSFIGTVLDAKTPFVIMVGLELPQTAGYTGASAAAPTFAKIAKRVVDG